MSCRGDIWAKPLPVVLEENSKGSPLNVVAINYRESNTSVVSGDPLANSPT